MYYVIDNNFLELLFVLIPSAFVLFFHLIVANL